MQDYDTVDSKSLGNYSNYKASEEKKMDVVFKPDVSNGFYSILSLNMGGYGVGYDLTHDSSNNSHHSDSETDSEYDISGQNQLEGQKPLYSVGKSPINNVFIGSVTVLGIYLLYRLLQKTK